MTPAIIMDPTNSTADTSNIPTMEMNGHDNANEKLEGSTNLSATTQNPDTYDELFPGLPGITVKTGEGNPLGSKWGSKPKMIIPPTVTQVFHIPMEERRGTGGFGADDSYKKLKTVMEKSGAKIEMSTGSKDQSLTFLITGKQETVLKARRDLLAQFQTKASSIITIPKEHHRFILGRGGSNLQDIETRTATQISIPKVNENSDKITVSGPKDGIETAIHELQLISDVQSKQAYEVLPVLKIYHPFINGPSGEYVKQMLSEYPDVRVNIPPLSVMKDELSVAGEKNGVLAVVEKIKEIAKVLEKKATTVSVEVKKSQHKYVIGPKGNAINEILKETGVFVEMPSSDSTSETITLRGPQEKLGLALTKVYEKANSVVSYAVTCPTWLHKYIIGRKGAGIQKLTGELQKVHVEFMDSGNSIKIEGPPDEADKARDILQNQSNELENKMSFAEISIDAKYHKHIIGKGGSNVNKIKQNREVTINIPDETHGSAIIRIEGNKQGVDEAKAELEEMVTKMKDEKEKDLIIENRFHKQLIGPKGENIQKIRDDFSSVQISFPDLGVKSDIVKLRGPKDDVDLCAKTMTKMYKDLLESNFQLKLPIFKQFHKFIIGKGGATIKLIRQETNAKVDLPASGSDSDIIILTGKKEDVLKAQKKIQQIQSEQADVVSCDLIIPAKIHNTIIGAGGKLIQSIMDDCGGVYIKFPDANSGSDKVNIRGPKDDVDKAKKLLVDLSNEKQLTSLTAEVRAKPEHHKFLIGRQGANIQSVRDKTGARIIFPNEKDKDRDVITILGTKEAVAQAKIELESRIKDLDNVIEETMTVDAKHHRYFVAKRGEILRNIGEEFGGVTVSFPRPGVTSDKVTLKGAKNCVDAARERINSLIEDLESQVTIECVIEQQHHRTIMGARGANIQKVCSDFNVQIKIPDRKSNKAQQNGTAEEPVEETNGHDNNDSDIIRISGKTENVENAAAALKALVPINIEVDVPFEFHRFIIGRGGENVRQLMNKHDVNIKVPSSDQQSSVVIVTGPKAHVESAEKDLLNKVEELEKEKAEKELKSFEIKIDIKPEYHPKIIGHKGGVISKFRTDFDVNIQLPKRDHPEQSTITITGYEDNAIKARDAMLKIVEEFESMTKEEVMIDHRVHSMIIGRKGTGIRKIQQDFNVEIKLPREGDPNPNMVIIMGNEEGVLDCKDHLLNIQEEFLQEVIDKELLTAYEKPPSRSADKSMAKNSHTDGFKVVKGAPWQGASDEASFPTLGGGSTASSVSSTPIAWGPKR